MPSPLHRPLARSIAAALLASLAAGGLSHDNDRDRHRLPRLSPAKPAALIGACEDLEARLAGMPGTVITDAITVAASPRQESRSPSMDVLILGGRPIREPVAWMGPFVMNTREEVIAAFADYQAGRLGSIPADHHAPTSVVTSDGGT